MSTISSYRMAPWVSRRILQFFNSARTSQDITQFDFEVFAGEKAEYGIGETVAERIIERKQSLPYRRYQHIDELDNLKGLGEEKIKDLIQIFQTPAAEAFKRRLYHQQVLLDNWDLHYDSTYFHDKEHFDTIVQDPQRFTSLVASRVKQICIQTGKEELVGDLAAKLLTQSYLESLPNGDLGSYALALWFYHFDQDNWFSYERMQAQTERYLNNYSYQDRMELRLYKGFPNRDVLSQSVTTVDLPVVVNYGEQKITLWRATLND